MKEVDIVGQEKPLSYYSGLYKTNRSVYKHLEHNFDAPSINTTLSGVKKTIQVIICISTYNSTHGINDCMWKLKCEYCMHAC